jgi:hypothetical protein
MSIHLQEGQIAGTTVTSTVLLKNGMTADLASVSEKSRRTYTFVQEVFDAALTQAGSSSNHRHAEQVEALPEDELWISRRRE